MKKVLLISGLLLLFIIHNIFSQNPAVEYKLIKKIPVAGNGNWNKLMVETTTHRLFISHGNQVDVLDLKTEKPVGKIINTPDAHSIACVKEHNKGYITAGKLDSVVVFDLTSLSVLKKIKTDLNSEAVIYDTYTKKLFVFNTKNNCFFTIDPKTDLVTDKTSLPGKPKGLISDGRGKLFCGIEENSSIVKIDAKTNKIDGEWPLKPGRGPTALAIDMQNNRLFTACGKSKQIMVMSTSTGNVLDTIPIGEGCEGIVFIPEDKAVVASNSDGTVTVATQKNQSSYEVSQTLKTGKNARTITYGRMTRKMYLPAADIIIENGKKKIVPGTFGILVVGK